MRDFENVCEINDLGQEKTFIEPGVTDLYYYYPGPVATATFDTVTLVCIDGSVFSYLDVWELDTEN